MEADEEEELEAEKEVEGEGERGGPSLELSDQVQTRQSCPQRIPALDDLTVQKDSERGRRLSFLRSALLFFSSPFRPLYEPSASL